MGNKFYLAIGEESSRGTPESSTVGFVPLADTTLPALDLGQRRKQEFYGQESALGKEGFRRLMSKWSYTLTMPFFTEAGTVSGIVGTLLKHFFGYAGSSQNGSTGQYLHMMYAVKDPFNTDSGYLGTKALTLNFNFYHGDTVKNHAYYGGRVTGVTFTQTPGELLQVAFTMVGQGVSAASTLISNPTYAAENLRCDYHDLTLYTGTITRTGTGPDFTQFTFASATSIKHDSVTIALEKPTNDKLRNAGVLYPDKTKFGEIKATVELAIDFEDPASGFSSADDRDSYIAAISSTNFFAHWDTGTIAGTGDNHGLYLDIPIAQRMGGDPEHSKEENGIITLNYEADYDSSTTKYLVGCMLKNTATTV